MINKVKANMTYIVVGCAWVVTFILTGIVYYSCVYGDNNGNVVAASEAENYINQVEKNDILEGKYIVGFGDSIMRGKGTNGVSVTQIIAEKHNMKFQDFSRSAATIASKERTEIDLTLNMLEQVKILTDQVDYTDYIVFNGGTNDCYENSSIPLGEITKDFESERDITTYCGAFEEIVSILKNKYPNAVIVYVRAHIMDRRTYKSQLIFGEEAIKMCEKWGIQYADLFNDSEFNTFLDRYKKYTMYADNYPEGDMVHPTMEGYELFYLPLIEKAYEKAVIK